MQTSYSQTSAVGFAGLLDGIGPMSVRSYAAEEAIPLAYPVKLGTTKDKEYQVGVSVPFGAFTVAAGYSKANSESAGRADLEGSGYTLVGTYDLSKRTTLYVGYKATDVDTSATAKAEAVQLCLHGGE